MDPDLAVYGVLRKKDAALFVEYDGYWRHGEEEGILKDERKNVALLANAPQGSWVVRLSHTRAGSQGGNVLWISVSPWRQGEQKALGRVLQGSLRVLLTELQGCFRPGVEKRLQMQAVKDILKMSPAARKFCDTAANAAGGSTQEEINDFLRCNGFCNASIKQFERKVVTSSLSIQWRLEASVAWLCEIGLAEDQVSKVISRCPNLLNCSIEQNLKPTVKWLVDLGLRKDQVPKALATAPQILCCSIEKNLMPTVEWLLELGLSKDQVSRAVVAGPQILGYSIEQNLMPTVEWLLELGLSKPEVAKVITAFPKVFGYSMEQNSKPTVHWLLDLGLSRSEVARTLAVKPQILGYSLEHNLKPKVRWLQDLGLKRDQISRQISMYPVVLGLSITNLKIKIKRLNDVLTKEQVVDLIARSPCVLGHSIERFQNRLEVLARQQNDKGKI